MSRIHRYLGSARQFTPLLRTSMAEQWPAVREFLSSVGVDPAQAAVGDMYPDQGLLIVVVVRDGRAFELSTWYEEDDPSKFRIEDWRELDAEGRFHHSNAIHAALVLLSEETSESLDPVQVLTEAIERLTVGMRTEDDWSSLRHFVIERKIDPQRSILVDWRHALASDSPPERQGTLYIHGKWFTFSASEESPMGSITSVTAWREIDEDEARNTLGAKVDAALRTASKEGDHSAGGAE